MNVFMMDQEPLKDKFNFYEVVNKNDSSIRINILKPNKALIEIDTPYGSTIDTSGLKKMFTEMIR